MNDTTDSDADTLRLSAEGRMTGEATERLETEFTVRLGAFKGNAVIIDLSRVSMMDSKGVGLCVGVFKECAARRVSFLIEAAPPICKLLTMLNLDKTLAIKEVLL